MIPTVSSETWLGLYQAAFKFYEIVPWDWMYDSDIFGVQNPETGEIAYCCVLGAGGSCYGLVAYRGAEGLDLHQKIQNHEIKTEDAIFAQNALFLEFAPKKVLDKVDRNVIESLGIKSLKQGRWPHFRNHSPGFYPWYLTEEEARFLTLVIRRACLLAVKFGEDHAVLEPDQPGQILVDTPEKKGGELKWSLKWDRPRPVASDDGQGPLLSFDEVHLKRVASGHRPQQGAWEAAHFYLHSVIGDRDRPYYARMTLIADRDSGFILGSSIFPPESDPDSELLKGILTSAEKYRLLPEKIFVKEKSTLRLLDRPISMLGVKLHHAKRLRAIEEAKNELRQRF